MRCSSCNEENRDGAAYCLACGDPLALSCASCGRELPREARFCDACGARVGAAAPPDAPPPPGARAAASLRERAPADGERRIVTVLFVDAVGSTERSGRIDPEELHQIVRQCTDLMIDAVTRFEGTVTQFRGDGIMAVFGAPVAHEDSARGAVCAALAMRDALADYGTQLSQAGQRAFAYRIGLHTGPVIVGTIGNDFSMDYTAIGDTVNLAARMEQWAAPGTVYITGDTHRAAGPYFDCRDLGWLEVKGKAEPVRVYEALAERSYRTRLEAMAERGLTPYVGRAAQLDELRRRFEMASRGSGQVVFIAGEAGMGKSRMLLEFHRSLGDVRWIEGRCVSWGNTSAYRPIIDIATAAFGIDECDDPATAAQRVDDAVAGWPPARAPLAPLYKHLLMPDAGDASVAALDPHERRVRTLEAMRALLIELSRGAPLVLCVEDLHWADDQSCEALGAMIDAARGARALILLTHRTQFAPEFATREYFSHLSLPVLRPDDSIEMVRSVLQGGGVPRGIQSMIVAKADGNPFFIEEVTRSLVDSGVLRATESGYELARGPQDVRIPDTIHEVLLSRLDRLDLGAREVAQYAALIGRDFARRLLEHVAGDAGAIDKALSELIALELVYEKPGETEVAYTFKHALTQEVALGTLLGARRKQLHRDVAVAIEAVYADRLSEHHDALSYHYYYGEEWEPARRYAELVAERAQRLYAPRATIEHLDRAIDAATRLSAMPPAATYRARGMAHEAVGDFDAARADHESALGAATEGGDAAGQWRAHADLGMLWAGRDYERTGNHFVQAHEIASGLEDRAMLAHSLNRLGNWRLNIDRAREALADHEAALAIFEELGERRGIAETLDFMQICTAMSGDIVRAVDVGLQAAALYAGLGDRKARCGVLAVLAIGGVTVQTATMEQVEPYPGDPAVFAGEALEIARQIEWRAGESFALMSLGLAHGGRGEYARALEYLESGLRIAEQIGHEQWQAGCLVSIGAIYAEALHFDEAEAALHRALRLASSMGSEHWRVSAVGALAEKLVDQGRADDAALVIGGAITPGIAGASMAQRALMLAQMALETARGEPERALAIADALCTSLPRPPRDGVRSLPWVALRRGDAHSAAGRLDEAAADFEAAAALGERLGSRGLAWRAHAGLGRVRESQGAAGRAADAYASAWRAIEAIAADLSDDMRLRFLRAGAVAQVRKAAGVAI